MKCSCEEQANIERMLRNGTPEWLWKICCFKPFGFKGLGVVQPFKFILTKKTDPFTNKRVNGVYK